MFYFILLVGLVAGKCAQVKTQCDFAFSDGSPNLLKLPPNFLFGAGSSAPQIEGAWNIDGKGESDWDNYWHTFLNRTADGASPDVSCNSYHLWEHDVDALQQTGLNAYRFSMSWSRLLPTGNSDNINHYAVEYYNALIDKLLEKNITPMVTLYHFDMPMNITKLGGWTNSVSIDYFHDYAEFAFRTFGHKVKYWITINEPSILCSLGYGRGSIPPGIKMEGVANYLCGHNILLAHATAYRTYRNLPPNITDKGKVGISLGFNYYYPENNRSLSDYLAAQIAIDFTFGWMANPIFGIGGYPISMRTRIDELSWREGRPKSRLPHFTPAEILLVKGSTDFVGINHYTSYLTTFAGPTDNKSDLVSADSDVIGRFDPSWKTTAEPQFPFAPRGMGDALRYLRKFYNNPPVIVTENGYSGYANESIECNPDRELWFKEYIAEVLESIQDGCNVGGYFAWSLLDAFEIDGGYTLKYGITHIDFSSPNRTRTVKGIGLLFQNIIKYGLPAPN